MMMKARKILVVDDERIVAEDIKECLRGMGCEVCGTAKSGPEAIEKAERNRPDLVLMDIVLQGQMDGVEAARVIREEWGIPVVFLSAYSDAGVLDRAKKIGPLGYVVKPFDEAGLRTTVEVALHRLSMDSAVRESGDWFATTLKSIGDGVIATAADGRISFVNGAAEVLSGCRAGRLTGELVDAALELYDEETKVRGGDLVAEAMAGGDKVELKRGMLVRVSGEHIPVDVSATPIRDQEGTLVGAVLVLRDASERRNCEVKERIERQKLESLVNERTREILKSNKRLLGEIEERKRAEMALNYRMGIQKLVSSVMSRFLQMKRGEGGDAVRSVLEQLGGFLEVDAAYLLTFNSVEDRIELTAEWRQVGGGLSEDSVDVRPEPSGLQVLAGWRERISGPESVIISRDEGGDVDGGATLLGKVAKARGARSVILLPLMAEEIVTGFIGVDSFGDSRRWTREDATVLRMVGDVVQAALRRQRQGEENELLMEQLYQSQKMEAIGKLSGGIAHDFNNMLLPIIGYSDMLIERIGENGQMGHELREIRRSAERAASLTQQMLTFSRKQVIKKVVVDLNEHLGEAKNMLGRIIGEDIDLRTNFSDEAPAASVDPGQIEQVLMNLVVNARDAMPGGGIVEISTGVADSAEENVGRIGGDDVNGKYAWISVRDTGCGMDPVVIERVFEPFFSTKGSDGTGLGLSVVYGIVEQHSGGIRVEAIPGEGSEFTVYFPAVNRRFAREVRSSSPVVDVAGAGERILLVEDEVSVIQFVSQALKQKGYEVFSAMSVREAVEVYEKEGGEFDMFFTDAVLPDGNGVGLLDDLLTRRPGTPALLSSGYTDKNSLIELAKEKNITFLQKPYALPLLFQTVREVIEQRTPEAVLH